MVEKRRGSIQWIHPCSSALV